MENPPDKRDMPVRSVRKALGLLNLLVFDDPGREGLSLGSMAERLGFPAATAHSLLKSLCACGYAEQVGHGRYTVGPRCLEIGRYNRLLSEATSSAIRNRMELLGRELDEIVTLAVLADGRRLRLWSTEPGRLVRIDTATLEASKLFSVPTGRVLAAYASQRDRDLMLARYGLPTAEEWPQAASPSALDQALAEIRDCGQAAVFGGDLAAFAVPVFDAAGSLAGSLGCFTPIFRCPASQHAAILASLKQAARDMAAAF